MKKSFIINLLIITVIVFMIGCTDSQIISDVSASTRIAKTIFYQQTVTTSLSTITIIPTITEILKPTITTTPTATQPWLGIVKTNSLELFEGPSFDFEVIGIVERDDNFKILGQYLDCAWVKVQNEDGLEGWLLGYSAYLSINQDCKNITVTSFRPYNKMVIFGSNSDNKWFALKVANNTSKDSVVVLVKGNEPEVAFYIRANSEASLEYIDKGSYDIYMTSGSNWLGNELLFKEGQLYKKYEQPVIYDYSKGVKEWEITLNESERDNYLVNPINIEEFPKLIEE